MVEFSTQCTSFRRLKFGNNTVHFFTVSFDSVMEGNLNLCVPKIRTVFLKILTLGFRRARIGIYDYSPPELVNRIYLWPFGITDSSRNGEGIGQNLKVPSRGIHLLKLTENLSQDIRSWGSNSCTCPLSIRSSRLYRLDHEVFV